MLGDLARAELYLDAERVILKTIRRGVIDIGVVGNDSNLLIVFYVQIVPDDFVMQLHRF